jgi:hypothetical protein
MGTACEALLDRSLTSPGVLMSGARRNRSHHPGSLPWPNAFLIETAQDLDVCLVAFLAR